MLSDYRDRASDSASQILRWPTERARKWTCDLLNSAQANSSMLAVVAIGSAVRQNVVSADLDLIVISSEVTPVHISPPLEIDLRAYSAGSIDLKIASGHDLLGWAIRFGKVLYQRNHYWNKVVNAWNDRLPLPSAALARERAMAALARLIEVLESDDADAAQEQAVSYLTHLARAELLDRGVYPASRPELPSQLRLANNPQIAGELERLLRDEPIDKARMNHLLKLIA